MFRPEAEKKLLVIAGPTAVGKTAITVELARRLGCPVLSADARQCYQELGIATAKPDKSQLAAVKHYFINSHSIFHPLSAADYERYALKVLSEVFDRHQFCILSGGSGLYIKAVCYGLDKIPDIPENIKGQLQEEWQQVGSGPLLAKLKELDPLYYHNVDRANTRRVLRALEVCLATGQPYSSFHHGKPHKRPFQMIKVGLLRERSQLYQRIDQRMEQMIAKGLFKEAQALFDYRDLTPLQTVGYQEVFDYLQGKYSYQEAVRLLKRNSRRYAKRQLTWFKKDPSFKWFHPDEISGIMEYAGIVRS